MSKPCPKCMLPDRTFARSSKTRDGLQAWCKDCMRDYMRGRKGDPTKSRAHAKASAARHPERRRARERIKDAIRDGTLRPASEHRCTDCPRRAQAYDHPRGYDRSHTFDVEPVCHECHGRRSRARGEHQRVMGPRTETPS